MKIYVAICFIVLIFVGCTEDPMEGKYICHDPNDTETASIVLELKKGGSGSWIFGSIIWEQIDKKSIRFTPNYDDGAEYPWKTLKKEAGKLTGKDEDGELVCEKTK